MKKFSKIFLLCIYISSGIIQIASYEKLYLLGNNSLSENKSFSDFSPCEIDKLFKHLVIYKYYTYDAHFTFSESINNYGIAPIGAVTNQFNSCYFNTSIHKPSNKAPPGQFNILFS